MRNWRKLGRIFAPKNDNLFLSGHAANPLPIKLKGDVFRIFYSGRNKQNKSSVGYVDIDIVKQQICNYPHDPVFIYGDNNTFYSHGISIGNIYQAGDAEYILFMGWQYPSGEHWKGDIGRFRLVNNEKLVLEPESPFMPKDEEDNISLSYPFVIYHEGIYRMWYGSTITWKACNDEMVHVIKYATSIDGNTWEKHGIAIPYEIGVAQAFSKPSVIINESGYHMWFSYRSGDGTTYRIGYAHSVDGVEWKRYEKLSGIDVSSIGWDSEMICYPFVFSHDNQQFMLYNGNGYGKTGFGLAVLEY